MEDREAVQLLFGAGATQAGALAHLSQETALNTILVGYEDPGLRQAIEEMVRDHNADSDWIRSYNPGKLLSARYLLMPAVLAHEEAYFAWRPRFRYTHAAVLTSTGRAAGESSVEYLEQYKRASALPIAIARLREDKDADALAALRAM